MAVTTDQAGGFSVELPAGTYDVRASRPGYLPAIRAGLAVLGAQPVLLPLVTLLAGDVDRDGAISWPDLRLIVGSIIVGAGTGLDDEGGPDPNLGGPNVTADTDLNSDGVVDAADIALAAVNFSLTLSPWPGP